MGPPCPVTGMGRPLHTCSLGLHLHKSGPWVGMFGPNPPSPTESRWGPALRQVAKHVIRMMPAFLSLSGTLPTQINPIICQGEVFSFCPPLKAACQQYLLCYRRCAWKSSHGRRSAELTFFFLHHPELALYMRSLLPSSNFSSQNIKKKTGGTYAPENPTDGEELLFGTIGSVIRGVYT